MDELREAMNAAFGEDDAREEEESQLTESEGAENDAPDEPEAESFDEPSEEGQKKEPGIAGSNKEEALETNAPEAATEQPQAQGKAPASWSARARETWGKLPPEAQAEVSKREGEINRVLQESATARRAVQELNQVLAPHAQRLMASGMQNPIQAIGTLLQTEGQLRQGDAQAKAQTIANLVRQYGVDINALDAALSGQPMPQQQNGYPQGLEQMIDQRLAPFQDFLSQQRAYQQHQQEQSRIQAQQSVEEFSKNAEFINEVRMQTASILDEAAKMGQHMELQEAYDIACSIHPEVKQVLAERKRQADLMGQAQQTQAKKKAAVSITGDQGGSGSGAPDGDLRSTISQVWNDALSR